MSDGTEIINDKIVLLIHPKMEMILEKVVLMLYEGFRKFGFDPQIANELQNDQLVRAIILGSNFFEAFELTNIASNSIILNVENIDSEFITESYLKLLKKYHVWDYNESNAVELSDRIGRPIRTLKLFLVDALLRLKHAGDKDIDVLFYGSFNARREAVLDDLRARGLRVHAVYQVYGAELDALIERAKVVINLHFYDNGCFEIIRVFDLLANRCAVVCEVNPGEFVDADLADAIASAPYEQLADMVEALVRDPVRREAVAAAGHRAFQQRSACELLRTALAGCEAPVVPSAANMGSGKAYDPNLLNIDINPRMHPDIVADIMDRELFEREFASSRFGVVRLQRGWFDAITLTDVLEHLPDLVTAMTNLLDLLADGGVLNVGVPYDLSYGAWQDPTHVRAFNERSWLYYCEWFWYLNWTEARFDLDGLNYTYSPVGQELAQKGVSLDEILRTPRAVDAMNVVLRKRPLTEEERAHGRAMRGDARQGLVDRV